MTCALDLEIDEYLQRIGEQGQEDPLKILGDLPEPAPLETVESLLRALTPLLVGNRTVSRSD